MPFNLPDGLVFLPENPNHDIAISELNSRVFGPGAYTRVAFRIREQGPHDLAFSAIAMLADRLVATVRMTSIMIGEKPAFMLGPLAVEPELKGLGIGKTLLKNAVAATDLPVLLVGDPPYYGPFGFSKVLANQMVLPGPYDPSRLLVANCSDEERGQLSGIVRHKGS